MSFASAGTPAVVTGATKAVRGCGPNCRRKKRRQRAEGRRIVVPGKDAGSVTCCARVLADRRSRRSPIGEDAAGSGETTPALLPLDGAGRLAGYVQHDPVDLAQLVDHA